MPELAFIHASTFYEITALMVLAAAVGFVGLLLRQPMIVSLIAVGVLAGPSVTGIVRSEEHVQLLAELGVAVLLFLVGLKLDLKLIRSIGRVALATGLGQVAFTAAIGFLIGLWLGLDPVTSLYVAVALTFSSTIIIVKLLTDKKEADALHGRIAIGFLIVQDLFVVLAMMVLSAFGIGAEGGGAGTAWRIASVLVYGLLMLVFVGLFIRYLATPLVNRIARSSELLVIFAIGWAALLATIGSQLGFSKELGGLLAGVSLASTPFREAVVARLSPVRDFLLLFFFIALGTQMELGQLGDQVVPALVLSLFVLVGNPLIVLVIMGALGYRKRTGFLAGLTVAQISEFSLIFMGMGVTLGHVGPEALGLVTLVGLITIALSVYMITYSHTLYRWAEPFLGWFEKAHPAREELMDERDRVGSRSHDLVLFGLGRHGSVMLRHLESEGFRVLGVDFNPEVVRRLRHAGFNVTYGDASDQEFIGMLPLDQVPGVMSAMPPHVGGVSHEDPRLALVTGLRNAGYAGKCVVLAYGAEEREALAAAGADLVLLPFEEAATNAVARLRELLPGRD